MTFQEAKEYAESVLGWTVADLREPHINKTGVERVYCYSLQLCLDGTPDEFVAFIEREQYRVEKLKEGYAREVRGETDEDRYPGVNDASTWVNPKGDSRP